MCSSRKSQAAERGEQSGVGNFPLLQLAHRPPCSPPKKQPMGINLRAWLAADLKQSASLSLSLSDSSTLTEMFLSFTLYSPLPFFPFQRIPLLMKMESSFSARANNIIFLKA